MRDYRPWTNLEIKFLQIGFCPQGRTQRACRVFCRRNGIKFVGKRVTDENEELINRIDKQFTSNQKGNTMAKSNQKKTATASVKDAKAAAKTTSGKPATAKPEERSYNFRVLDVKNIKADDNIREVKNIEDLLASIQEHGIVNPVTVVDEGNSNFKVIAGFRRFAAAVQLGLKKIPCHVMLKNREGVDEISLTENITRMDMTPYEECMAVKALSGKKKTPAAIAKHFGRTLRWVLVRKKLADAGDKVLKKVKDGSIELGAAAKIADLPDNVFKKELEGCYRTDKYFIEGVLDRFHKDLSKAPFEHEACLKCDKCSACQADLFENEPKAYCLDPNCWARKAKKAAEAKVKKLQEEGKNARLGKFSSYGVDSSDEADDFEIGKWNTKAQEQAKEAGIQKRVLVDAATGKTFEYFDKRDLPDYHEETEEEREERENAERAEARINTVREKLLCKKLQHAVAFTCCDFKQESDMIVTFLVFVADNSYEFFDKDSEEILGIDENDENGCPKNVEEMPDNKTFHDVGDAVRKSIEQIASCINDIDRLKKLLKVLGENVDEYTVTDKEVEDEIKRQDEERAKNKSEDDEEDFDGEDSDE